MPCRLAEGISASRQSLEPRPPGAEPAYRYGIARIYRDDRIELTGPDRTTTESPAGGDTLWADAGAVYSALPDELRSALLQRSGVLGQLLDAVALSEGGDAGEGDRATLTARLAGLGVPVPCFNQLRMQVQEQMQTQVDQLVSLVQTQCSKL